MKATYTSIHKYPLVISRFQSILIPKGARVLSVQQQGVDGSGNPKLVLWAIVDTDPSAEQWDRGVHIVGTGHALEGIDRRDDYVSTVVCTDGFVWHVFVERDPP